jgi:hypothetical protein
MHLLAQDALQAVDDIGLELLPADFDPCDLDPARDAPVGTGSSGTNTVAPLPEPPADPLLMRAAQVGRALTLIRRSRTGCDSQWPA